MKRLYSKIILLGIYFFVAQLSVAEINSYNNCGIVGSLDNSGKVGRKMVSIYTGNIAPDRYCVLTIYNNEFSGDGFYTMQLTDSDATVEMLYGKRYTLRGQKNATIWQCNQSNQISYYFQKSSSDVIYYIPDDNSLSTEWPLQLLNRVVIKNQRNK